MVSVVVAAAATAAAAAAPAVPVVPVLVLVAARTSEQTSAQVKLFISGKYRAVTWSKMT